MRLLRRLLLGLVVLAVAFVAFVAAGLPRRADVSLLARENPKETSVMRQRSEEAERAGRTLRRIQTWVPLSRVSRHLVQAVVAAEDQNFFGHEGVDWDAIRDSMEKDVKKGQLSRGGSTLTQQLAKNVFFTTYKNPIRKLRELVVARWMEQDLTKARILELYVNVVEWGDGVYGCDAAARRYYGKPASDLGEVEAAGLAAMLPSPRRINPRTNPARHARAQKRVLWLMAHAGYLKKDVGGLGATPPPAEEPEEGGAEPIESDLAVPAPVAVEAAVPNAPAEATPAPTDSTPETDSPTPSP
jgi:monofunctional biosynthetic peptidoglycan transglycosylase